MPLELISSDVAPWIRGAPMDPAAEPPEPLPALEGFPYVYRGASALVSGPTGHGRSSLVQAGAYDAVLAGHRIAYLGSEVTEPEFNARAREIAGIRGHAIDDGLRATLSRVRYLDLADVMTYAWANPEEWKQEMSAAYEIVIIDPQSAVASALDLDFDTSNTEYVRYYERLIQPLVTAHLAVVTLDNIGHAPEARRRSLGVSAKGHKADVTLSCKLKARPVGLIVTVDKRRSVRAPFVKGDAWIFDKDTQSIEPHATEQDGGGSGFRPTEIMGRVEKAVAATPGLSRNALRQNVQGKNETVLFAVDLLVAEGSIHARETDGNRGHFSGPPSPDAGMGMHPPHPPHPYAVPDPSPVPGDGTHPPIPIPYKRDGGCASVNGHQERLVTDSEQAHTDSAAQRAYPDDE